MVSFEIALSLVMKLVGLIFPYEKEKENSSSTLSQCMNVTHISGQMNDNLTDTL